MFSQLHAILGKIQQINKIMINVVQQLGKMMESENIKINLCYLPISPQLKRIFTIREITKHMIWHSATYVSNGVLSYLVHGLA